MPKTEAELWDWVVEYNRHTTHNRGLTSNYGYQAILDVNLVQVCTELRARLTPPIRILDIGCGNGRALKQLEEYVARTCEPDDFEFWGMGVNRYEQMYISDDRLINDGLNAHDFGDMQFHLIVSVFAFHYMWHKLEAVEKIHNRLLVEGGRAFLHFPGYLVRFGETPQALNQAEADGNLKFADFLAELKTRDAICPMHYRLIPNYSDDDDCALLAEFGHLRFEKNRETPIDFGHALQAFSMFENGFACQWMNSSQRIYVASHYRSASLDQPLVPGHAAAAGHAPAAHCCGAGPGQDGGNPPGTRRESGPPDLSHHLVADLRRRSRFNLDVAIHEQPSDRVVLICPGACESLAGRVLTYVNLAERILAARLGAVVRYNDPYDHECNYADFLLEKIRCLIEFVQSSAIHFCSSSTPTLQIMAYSSSAGAAAAVASDYDNIETLLLVAPSYDVPRDRVRSSYAKFAGNVRILVGESDRVVLPEQAFWYYEQAANAASREYVEVPCCGHAFEGPYNKSVLLDAPRWAFGDTRPDGFPPVRETPSDVWL